MSAKPEVGGSLQCSLIVNVKLTVSQLASPFQTLLDAKAKKGNVLSLTTHSLAEGIWDHNNRCNV